MRVLIAMIAFMSSMAVQAAQPYVKNEYLIRFKSFDHARKFYSSPVSQRLGRHKVVTNKYLPIGLLRTNSPVNRAMLDRLKADPNISYVDPNYIYTLPRTETRTDLMRNRAPQVPNDNRFKELWGLYNTGKNRGVAGMDVNAIEAWKVSKGIRAVKIAVVDTGIDYNHPDLKANLWINTKETPGDGIDNDKNGVIDDVYGYNAYSDSGDPMDGHSHGTHCSGTIGAVHNNQVGVAGVMGTVQLMAVKIFSDGGSTTSAAILRGIEYAIAQGAHAMSNSWGGGGFSKPLFELIEAASKKGILFIAAAGNNGRDLTSRPFYPASYDLPNVISVAAMDSNGKRASFSNYSATKVHVAAPGVKILSTTPRGNYGFKSGTSMATPHVSGVVGLVLSTSGLRSVTTMRQRLIQTSKQVGSLKGVSISNGVVDAKAAMTGRR